MKKLLTLCALIGLFSYPALANTRTETIDATTDLVEVTQIKRNSSQGESYKASVLLYGTFNGCTIHWLISTDDGTTKTAVKNLSGSSVTSTAADNFGFAWGLPSGNGDGAILYASAAGCSSAPSLTVDVQDNR